METPTLTLSHGNPNPTYFWGILGATHTHYSGKVDLDEFLAAMTDWSTLESRLQESDATMYDVLLEEVFQIFDTDSSGLLNVDEVAAVRVVCCGVLGLGLRLGLRLGLGLGLGLRLRVGLDLGLGLS